VKHLFVGKRSSETRPEISKPVGKNLALKTTTYSTPDSGSMKNLGGMGIVNIGIVKNRNV
jgi:hypothetical protein